jgi:hypothetical protein
VGWSVRRCAYRIRHSVRERPSDLAVALGIVRVLVGCGHSNRDLGSPEAIAWLVKCWHGAHCQAIQRKVGGKATISTGPILCSLIATRERADSGTGVRFVAPMAPRCWMAASRKTTIPTYRSIHACLWG